MNEDKVLQNKVSVVLTLEEIRVAHQALNEVCNGIHFEDSEFSTRIGTERENALKLMDKLKEMYLEGRKANGSYD